MDNEQQIKAKVLERLRRDPKGRPAPLIATEFSLATTGVRADLVLAYRTPRRELVGIEIKSALDSLRRFPHQIETYSRVFDRVIVVAATRHQRSVRQYDFPNLDIWEIENSGILTPVRQGAPKPQAFQFSKLLSQRDQDRYRGFISAGSNGERDAFFAVFEDRFGECSREFWSQVQGRRIKSFDLDLLSRGHVKRAIDQKMAREYAEKLAQWAVVEAA